MPSKRTTETAFWISLDLRGAGPLNKEFFQWTMTGPRSNYAGLFRLAWDDCMDETELSRRQITVAIGEGTRREFLRYDPETRVLWVVKRLSHEFPTQQMSDKQREGIKHIVTDLPKCPLILDFCTYYQHWGDPFETLSKPIRKGLISVSSSVSSSVSVSGSGLDPLPKGPATNTYHPDRCQTAWNEICHPLGCSRVLKLDGKRLQRTTLRLAELRQTYPDQDPHELFRRLCHKATKSDFLMGRKAGGYPASYDWLLGNDKQGVANWLKLIEGRYDNRSV